MPRYLVTGGAGFIGSHLVDRLVTEDNAVIAFDDLSTGSLSNVRKHLRNSRFRLVQGDISDFTAVKKAVRGTDVVFHEAAIVSQHIARKKPQIANMVNVGGTLNVLRACVKHKVKQLVFASSSAIYGETKSIPIPEQTGPNPETSYAVSKLSAEAYCLAYHRSFGLNVTCLRYFNVYGPRQRGTTYSGVIPIFTKRLLAGKPAVIHGDGAQIRDFVHISDVVDATMRAADSPAAIGEAINVASGKPTSIESLAHEIIRIIGNRDMKLMHDSPRPGDIRISCADIGKARRLLNFEPSIELERGLRTVVDWFSERASHISH